MKNQILVTLSLVASAAAFASGGQAPKAAPDYREGMPSADVGDNVAGPRIVFQHPLTLSAKTLPVQVNRLESQYDRAQNQFVVTSNTNESRNCNMRLAIQGRDIAVNNKNLGEHYFGQMQMSCSADGWGQQDFTTTFSRVFVLGMRNCVESETMVDQDYCDLYVVALRRKTDVKIANGDLIEDNGNVLDKYRIHSDDALKHVLEGGFLPTGLNGDLFDSVQTFKLSIGKRANEYFIPATTSTTSIGGGRQYQLELEQDAGREETIANSVRTQLSSLESIVSQVRADGKPLDAFNAKSAAYFKLYADTTKTMLEIVHPVTFYRLEAELKGVETQVIELLKTYDSSIATRDALLSKYSSALGEYQKIRGYYSENANAAAGVNYNQLIGGAAVGRTVGKQYPIADTLIKTDDYYRNSNECEYRYDYKCALSASKSATKAKSMCEEYISNNAADQSPDPNLATADNYKCEFVRTYPWNKYGDQQGFITEYKVVVK